MQKFVRVWIVLLGLSSAALAKEGPVEIRTGADGAAPASAKIADLNFLVGHWIGSGLGGCSEEYMAPPAGGQIMGMFRQMTGEGGLRFYEFYSIQEKAGSLTLKIKHFNPDMTGWEDKAAFVEFPLLAIEGTTAFFDGLTFSRRGKRGFASAVMIDDQGSAQFDMRAAGKGEACGGK